MTQPAQQLGDTKQDRYFWGFWEIAISSDHQSIDLVPDRTTDMHLNAVRLLEETACTDCLTIGNVQSYPPDEITVDLTLRHPYPGLIDYTVFDVRGIFISPADFTFPESGRSVAWGDGMARIMNADGYTSLFNPTEFPETQPGPPTLRYIPGKIASGGDLSSTLMPYIAYAEDEPRRMFGAGAVKTRTVRLRLPDGPLEFGYAVDGCWVDVPGGVTSPLDDFPPEANCPEAYKIKAETGSGLVTGSGSAEINVEVYDHQGLDTIESVTIEAPDLFNGEVGLSLSTVLGDERFLFTGSFENTLSAGLGEFPLLVKVTDNEPDPNLGEVNGWYVHTVEVAEKEGWALTWGGEAYSYGRGMALDGFGNMYVVGEFNGIADFDPGPGVDEHVSVGSTDAYLIKLDSNGIHQWAVTWGGDEYDEPWKVAVDDLGNVYVTGIFLETADFDPGPGLDEHVSNGGIDPFVSKYDSDGNYQWTLTWGSYLYDGYPSVTTDGSGNFYVTSWIGAVTDLDPGPDEDMHPVEGTDAYLSKFNSDGEYQWGRVWGAINNESGKAICMTGSSILVAGYFGTHGVDFDPGPGESIVHAVGQKDVFMSKFDSNGNFIWVQTWGGLGDESAEGITADCFGNIYVTGQFLYTVDFDPGPDVLEYTPVDLEDIFLSKFDSSGEFEWVGVWGSEWRDIGWDVVTDLAGNVYVTGQVCEDIDMDPGPGIDEHNLGPKTSVYLSKFHTSGDFLWAKTWGGNNDGNDVGHSLCADSSDNIYITGYFLGPIDFDPGLGMDIHYSTSSFHSFLSKFPPDGSW